MKTKTIFKPADPRLTIIEIVDPIYITREMWECSFHYIPLDQRSRIIIVDFIEEEETEDERK